MTDKKSKIFECYSNNLMHYNPSYEGYYACPICLKLYSRSDLINNNLTVEHIIPKKIGGIIKTLTCKQCNNESGSMLDVHLVNKINADEVLSGKSSRPLKNVELQAGEGLARGDLYVHDIEGKKHLNIICKPNLVDPLLLTKCSDTLNEGMSEFKLSGSLGYKEFNLQIAWLKIAYLLMFYYLGYGYILDTSLDDVREQIRDPNKHLITPTIIKLKVDYGKNFEVAYVSSPDKYKCFGAILNLSDLPNQSKMVMMPGAGLNSSDIADKFRHGGDINFNITTLSYKPEMLRSKYSIGVPMALLYGLMCTP